MKLKILVDNQALPGFKSEWGFSCLVEGKESVLFDTGSSAAVLGFNAEKLGVKPSQIGKLVLSHDHFDHTGGMQWVLQNSRVKVYVLDSFSGETKAKIMEKAELVEVSDAIEVSEGIFSTGRLSNAIDEQSLVIKAGKGNLVLTGCSHPGLAKILEKAKEFGGIQAVIGGFHGFVKFEALKGVKLVAATHCTQHKAEIARIYPKAFKECRAGTEFEFD